MNNEYTATELNAMHVEATSCHTPALQSLGWLTATGVQNPTGFDTADGELILGTNPREAYQTLDRFRQVSGTFQSMNRQKFIDIDLELGTQATAVISQRSRGH